MKKKLILKDSIIDTIMDANLILFSIFAMSRGTILPRVTFIFAIFSVIILILFGGINER
jgi:hypothetical protein